MKNTEEPWGKVEYGKTYKYFEADKKQLQLHDYSVTLLNP